MSIRSGQIIEMGYVVDDMEAAIRRLSDTTGAGPFFVYENMGMQAVRYRGQRASVPIDVAMGAVGDMVIELIRARDTSPSPFHVPDIAPSEIVFNHWSVFVADFEGEAERLAASGFIEVFSAEITGDEDQSNARLSYFQPPGTLAGSRSGLCCPFYEIMEMVPVHLLQSYQRVIDAGRNKKKYEKAILEVPEA